MKKVLLIASFFTITPVFLIICASYVLFSSLQEKPLDISYVSNPSIAYADLPSVELKSSEAIPHSDTRVEVVRKFFQKYNSPLIPFSQDIVDAADKYGLDFRLLPAIGMQESNNCKRMIEDSHNCWGYGIYGKTITKFDSYPAAIDAVTKSLATKYKNNGLVTPEEIMTMYTPSSNGSWAVAVNQFMSELQ